MQSKSIFRRFVYALYQWGFLWVRAYATGLKQSSRRFLFLNAVQILLALILVYSASGFTLNDFSARGEYTAQDTIQVGKHPLSIALNPNTNKIYVTNYQSHSISVIDGSQDKVVGNISDVLYPADIFVDEKSNKIYVNHKVRVPQSQNQYSAMPLVSIIDGSADKVIGNLSEAVELKGINPSTGELYIIQAPNTQSLVAIDEATNNRKSEVNLNYYPSKIVLDQSTNIIYVAGNESDSISQVNASTFQVMPNKIMLADIPVALDINPDTERIYVAYLNRSAILSLPNIGVGLTIPPGAVSVIDGSTDKELANIPVISPSALSVNPNTNTIYVANSFSGTISVLNGTENTIISADVKVGGSPQDIVVNPNTNKAYVANSFSNSITVISQQDSRSSSK